MCWNVKNVIARERSYHVIKVVWHDKKCKAGFRVNFVFVLALMSMSVIYVPVLLITNIYILYAFVFKQIQYIFKIKQTLIEQNKECGNIHH